MTSQKGPRSSLISGTVPIVFRLNSFGCCRIISLRGTCKKNQGKAHGTVRRGENTCWGWGCQTSTVWKALKAHLLCLYSEWQPGRQGRTHAHSMRPLTPHTQWSMIWKAVPEHPFVPGEDPARQLSILLNCATILRKGGRSPSKVL